MKVTQKINPAIYILAACLVFIPNILFAETADFDSLSEGIVDGELTDGGITFYNLDNGQSGLENVFIIDQGDGTISSPSFSGPNGLTATGYTPGAEVGYGAIKEVFITTEGEADSASIEMFTSGALLYGNTVTLEAIKAGTVVESASMIMADVVDHHFTLSIEGVVFDELRIVSSPGSQVLLLDNVTINTIDICECDLNTSGVCDWEDWRLFGQDWGRTDCLEPGNMCECDLTGNGVCDWDDWRLFGQDWGRADCPLAQ